MAPENPIRCRPPILMYVCSLGIWNRQPRLIAPIGVSNGEATWNISHEKSHETIIVHGSNNHMVKHMTFCPTSSWILFLDEHGSIIIWIHHDEIPLKPHFLTNNPIKTIQFESHKTSFNHLFVAGDITINRRPARAASPTQRWPPVVFDSGIYMGFIFDLYGIYMGFIWVIWELYGILMEFNGMGFCYLIGLRHRCFDGCYFKWWTFFNGLLRRFHGVGLTNNMTWSIYSPEN